MSQTTGPNGAAGDASWPRSKLLEKFGSLEQLESWRYRRREEQRLRDLAGLADARRAQKSGASIPALTIPDASQAILDAFFQALGPETIGKALIDFLRRPGPKGARGELKELLLTLLGDDIADAIASAVEEATK